MCIIDSVYINMSVDSRERFLEERIVPLGISGVSRVKVLQLITGFKDGQGLPSPVNDRIHDAEPRESEGDIFSATVHDIEEMFWGDPFNVCVESAGIVDCASLVCSLVHKIGRAHV